MEVNWQELPAVLVEDVARLLLDVEDFVRFRAVCKYFQSILPSDHRLFSPWVMLSQRQSGSDNQHSQNNHVRKFFNLSRRRTLDLHLPETRDRRCFGSPFGWLFTIGIDLEIHLLNPLTRSRIPLPSQPTFQYQYKGYIDPAHLRKIFVSSFAMSSNPVADSGCVVMVIYSQTGNLAFTNLGDNSSWTAIGEPSGRHHDILFFNGLFYAIGSRGMLKICEINKPSPDTVDFIPPPEDVQDTERFYLVEMAGGLHFVSRILEEDDNAPEDVFRYKTVCFEVYKLDFHSKKWNELFDLGDYALFIGTNISFSLSTCDYPQLKRNSIYFTDDSSDCYGHGDGGGHDMGIFDFEKENVEPFYSGEDMLSAFCPPILFVPSLM